MKYYSVMEDGLLYLAKAEDPGLKRLCVPASQNNTLRKLVLYQGHDARLHQGRDKTFDRIANHYYWPTLYNDVRRYVAICESCRKNGANLAHPGGSITSRAIPEERWDEVHMDWIAALPVSEEGFDNILVCVERITKFAYFIPAKSTDTAQDTAKRLFAAIF